MMYGYHWNLDTPLTFAISILPIIVIGLKVTLEATIAGFGIAMILGLIFALLRRANSPVIAWPIAGFVEFIRDTPLLVQLYFLYFVLPDYGVILPPFLTGAIALGLQYSAYTSEVYGAGLDAIRRGQWEASAALNLSRWQTYRDVVIPQAIPRVIPALGNYLVAMLKDTPILSTISIVDMLNVASVIGDRTFEYQVPLSMVGIIFLLLTLVCSAGIRGIESLLPRTGIPLR
jgi:polar amino acid transport system permease protein